MINQDKLATSGTAAATGCLFLLIESMARTGGCSLGIALRRREFAYNLTFVQNDLCESIHFACAVPVAAEPEVCPD